VNSVRGKPRVETLGSQDQSFLNKGVSMLPLQLNELQQDQLFRYGQLIQKWNRVYNLTAIRSNHELITHHLLDSLAAITPVVRCLDEVSTVRVLDVGAGAGLPGIVWAIARPDWQVTLIDTVQKKAAFMQQAIASLGLKNAFAVHGRVEAYTTGQPFNLIASRAFSSMENFIALAGHLLDETGYFAALKGRMEADSAVPEGWKIESTHPIQVPFLDEARHLFMIKR
jgi:16S rRNA (guanine527-N7)-methyltransferase